MQKKTIILVIKVGRLRNSVVRAKRGVGGGSTVSGVVDEAAYVDEVVDVHVVENLGADAFAYGVIGGQPMVVRFPGGHPVKAGDRLAVRAAEEHTHLFHAETGKRIEVTPSVAAV